MKKACNDNEELSFITLGALTANVMAYLRKEQTEQHPHDQCGWSGEQRSDDQKRSEIAKDATAA